MGHLSFVPPATPHSDTKWADGLRGIASLLVLTAHITRTLAPHLLSPSPSPTTAPLLMQLPILRCLIMGRASVAIFAILTGYVNALKPSKQMRAGQVDAALAGIAKAAFRRTGRFVIPAVLATTLSWLACQFGAYRLARLVDSAWIRDTAPVPSTSFSAALADWARSVVGTWTDGGNEYDRIQWTLCYLLRGSMLVYVTLVATAYMRARWRAAVFAVMYFYYWRVGDAVIGTNIYFGLLLTHLTLSPTLAPYLSSPSPLLLLASTLTLPLSLFLISYPEENPSFRPWSAFLSTLGTHLFPAGSDFARFYPGLGANLLVLAIAFNPPLKRLLSHPRLAWLGKMSFAVYLLHGPLMRTVLTWALWGWGSGKWPADPYLGRDGEMVWPEWWIGMDKGPWVVVLVVGGFYWVVYRVAGAWVRWVDPWCARWLDRVEEWVCGEEEGVGEKRVLLA